MLYRDPGHPVRGYDAPQRDVPFVVRWKTNTTGGTGHFAGTYVRAFPYVLNSAPMAVFNPVGGSGSNQGTNGMAGHLVRPDALNVPQLAGRGL